MKSFFLQIITLIVIFTFGYEANAQIMSTIAVNGIFCASLMLLLWKPISGCYYPTI